MGCRYPLLFIGNKFRAEKVETERLCLRKRRMEEIRKEEKFDRSQLELVFSELSLSLPLRHFLRCSFATTPVLKAVSFFRSPVFET